MKRLVLFGVVAAGAMVLAFVAVPESAEAGDPKPCTTEVKTDLIGGACKAGGKKQATKAMQQFMKAAKKTDLFKEQGKLTCKSCHTDLKKHERTDDGMKLYNAYKDSMGADAYKSLVEKYGK